MSTKQDAPLRGQGFNRRVVHALLALIAGVALASCGGGGGGSEPAPAPVAAPPVTEPAPVAKALLVDVDVSSASAKVGTPVTFTARVNATGTSASRYDWTFSDGQTASGATVSVSFKAAGVVTATLDAASADGTRARAIGSVSVFAGKDPTPNAYRLPDVYGDVDGDGDLDLADVLAVAQSLGGVQALSQRQASSADLDLDGKLTQRDLTLMMDAVAQGAPLPSAVLNKVVYPGGVFAVVSPTLLEPDAVVELRIGGQAASRPLRAVMGYASALAPSTLTTVGDAVPVEIVVNGTVADRLTVVVRALPAMPADARADVLAYFASIRTLIERQAEATAQQATASGVAPDKQAGLLTMSNAGKTLFDRRIAELDALLSGPGGDVLARRLQRALYANGLAEYRVSQGLSALPSATGAGSTVKALLNGNAVCDVMIPGVCALKAVADALDDANTLVNAACSAVSIGVFIGVVIPADGPAIEAMLAGAFLEWCVPAVATMEVASAASWLVAGVDLQLTSSASPSTLRLGETSRIVARVSFLGLQELCANLGSAAIGSVASDALEKWLGDRIVARMLRSSVTIGALAKIFQTFGEAPYAFLLGSLRDAASNALDASGLADMLGQMAGNLCPNLVAGRVQVPVNRVFKQPAIDEGVLQTNPDGSGTYSCAPAGPAFKSAVTLQGELKLCDSQPARTSVSLTCATTGVRISMGDNGTLNDDIFEVVIDGRTVLTSSSPTRSTATVVQLPRGRTTVTMRGLAAPDGVGTYFISFSGAAVISGSPTGNDLVPGTVKQFVIEVL